MNTLTKTSLNTPAVEKHYESLLTESTGHRKNLVKQKGSGLIMDLVGGVVGNVVKAVQAGRRLHKRKRAFKSTSRSKRKTTRQQRVSKTIKHSPRRKPPSYTQRGNGRRRVNKRSRKTTVRKTTQRSQIGRGKKSGSTRPVRKKRVSKTII